jgi:hypothetical protein
VGATGKYTRIFGSPYCDAACYARQGWWRTTILKEARSKFVTREHPQSVIATCDTSRRTHDAHDDARVVRARACALARSEPRPVGAERTCGCACGFHMRVAWQETVFLPECVRKRGMRWRNGRCYERMHMIVADLMIMCDRTSRTVRGDGADFARALRRLAVASAEL